MHVHTHFAVLRAVYDPAPGQDAELGDVHLVVQVTDERHGPDALGGILPSPGPARALLL